jgi:3-hydroxybutyryl-CoA dehydrogenase
MTERIGIAGSGAIACGLARVASEHGAVVVWARSDGSARRAEERLAECGENVTVIRELAGLRDATFVVESIVEDSRAKAELYAGLPLAETALLATTTSALSVEELALASGRPDRFCALHVFKPVHRMALVELSFPGAATAETRGRARAFCEALGKTAVEVPDVPGFVVNRLLFPYLFDAVRLHEQTALPPEAIDACMMLGAGHPMGPLALLDYVGLDVAAAIGRALEIEVPDTLGALVAEGALGKKAGRGFYRY